MSFFESLLRDDETKAIDASNLTWSVLAGGPNSKAGVTVTELTALRVAAVYACCRVICEDIGKLPLKLMQEVSDEEKKVAREHPLHRVISRRPNEWQTSMEWRATMLLHALLKKGGYSLISRGSSGEVLELLPLPPDRVTPRQEANWRVWYEVSMPDGKHIAVRREDMLVVRGLSWDGFSALELVKQGGEAIGLAMATEESQARLHGQGARPGGVLTAPNALSKEQIDRIKEQFANNFAGVANAFKTLLLDGGMEFKPWAMTGVDAQHLETRRHQVEEVCRLFRVFPSMIGFSDKASTYASAEAFFGAHVVHTLMPWVTAIEQAMDRDLLTAEEIAKGYHTKFFLQGLLRGDAKSRAEFYESAITRGCWMTRNEARRLEDLNPISGLDEVLKPLNMADASKPAPPAKPLPGAKPPPPGDPADPEDP